MNISSLEQFKDKYKIRYNPKKKQDIVVNIHDVKNTEDTDMGNEEKKSNKTERQQLYKWYRAGDTHKS